MVEVIDSKKFSERVFDFTTKEEWDFAGSKPVIVNFFATWCGPCQMFGPVLENAATRYEGKLDVYKIDIDTSPEVPALFGIRSVPTTLFIAPGKEPALAMGALSGDAVEQAIKEQLGL